MLAQKDINVIENIYLDQFINRKVPEGGIPQQWYNVITTFLSFMGSDLIEHTVRSGEREVLRKGLARKYFKGLLESQVGVDPDLDEYEKVVIVAMTPGEIREQILREVLGP